jgi:hypothetical protein
VVDAPTVWGIGREVAGLSPSGAAAHARAGTAAAIPVQAPALTAGLPGAERRLLRSLAGVVDEYDLALIDCPPTLLSHLIDNAWTASDYVLIPKGSTKRFRVPGGWWKESTATAIT